MPTPLDEMLDAWRRHNDLNLYILEWVPPEGLRARTLLKSGKPSRGRDVAGIFAHIYDVRCDKLSRNLETADDLPTLEGASSDGGEQPPDADALSRAFAVSGQAVADLVRSRVEAGEALRGWKLSPLHWLTYLVAHEAHHRGQIAQALKQSGVRPPQEVSYGVWGYLGGYDLKPLPS